MAALCTLVLTGAPLTARAVDIARAFQADGWDVQLAATHAAKAWIDEDELRRKVGRTPVSDFRAPRQTKRPDRPSLVVVAPMTFNTANKLALGIADTYVHSLLCEALGQGLPLLAVPMANERLWGHHALASSLDVLRRAGVVLLDVRTGTADCRPVPSGTGDAVAEAFDPGWLTVAAAQLVRPS
jgi:phosphopantothenoylcysteine synthetase/decarboxylase